MINFSHESISRWHVFVFSSFNHLLRTYNLTNNLYNCHLVQFEFNQFVHLSISEYIIRSKVLAYKSNAIVCDLIQFDNNNSFFFIIIIFVYSMAGHAIDKCTRSVSIFCCFFFRFNSSSLEINHTGRVVCRSFYRM